MSVDRGDGEQLQWSLESDPADGPSAVYLERCREHGATQLIWQTAVDNHRAQAVYDRVGGTSEPFLEYDLTRLVYSLANPEKPVVGVVSDLPVGLAPLPDRGDDHDLPAGFVLAVGTLEPRKNLPNLVRAFDAVAGNDHELVLGQQAMPLRGLRAAELGEILRASGIRWKVVVVSACYSGGFVDALQDERTLVITAARRDRRSFGCADENDFTYFGRAFFKEALPGAQSFQQAFKTAYGLVEQWERKETKDAHSVPQIHSPAAIEAHLQRWWAGLEKK